MTLLNRLRLKRRKPQDEAPAIARAVKGSLAWPGAAQDLFGQRIGLAVYEEMLTDPLIRSAITVKKLGALAVPWRISRASSTNASNGDSAAKAAFVEYTLAEMEGSVHGILLDAMDAIAKGYAVLEKVFVLDEREFPGKVRLHAVKPKDQRCSDSRLMNI